MRLLLLLALAAPLWAEAAAQGRSLVFRFSSGEFSNLSFQILCLADQLPCSQPAYNQLWRDRLAWSPADDDVLKSLHKTLRALPADYEVPAPLPPNYAAYYPSVVKLHRLKAALVGSRNAAEAHRRLLPVVGPQPAAEICKVLDHFAPRFHYWWTAEGRDLVRSAPTELTQLLGRYQLVDFSEELAVLLGLPKQAQPRVIRLHLIARPKLGVRSAFGTQLEDRAVLEVPAGDSLAESIGPVIHEMFHHFYDLVPRERHLALLNEFMVHSDPGSLAFYAYLNEAMATAAGILVDERVLGEETSRLRGRNANYAHPYIARLGRAILPLLRARLENHQMLLEGLTSPYLEAARSELRGDAVSPRFLLAQRTVQGNHDLIRSLAPLLDSIPAMATISGPDSLDRFPCLNAIVFARPQDLARPDFQRLTPPGTGAKLLELASGKLPFVYAQPRLSKSVTYYFVGPSPEDLRPLVERFAASDKPFTGLGGHLR